MSWCRCDCRCHAGEMSPVSEREFLAALRLRLTANRLRNVDEPRINELARKYGVEAAELPERKPSKRRRRG